MVTERSHRVNKRGFFFFFFFKCGGDGGTGNVFRQRNEKKIESA